MDNPFERKISPEDIIEVKGTVAELTDRMFLFENTSYDDFFKITLFLAYKQQLNWNE